MFIMTSQMTLIYSLIKIESDLEVSSAITVKNSDLVRVIADKYKEMLASKDVKKEELYVMLFLMWFLREHVANLVPIQTDRKNLGLQMAPVYQISIPKRIILFHGGTNLKELTEPFTIRSNILEENRLTMAVNLNVRLFKIKEFPETLLTKWLAQNPETMTTNLYLENIFKKEVETYTKKSKDKKTGLFSKLMPTTSKANDPGSIENFLK
ncbi:matrix protein [Cucurbit cytorhabdovirus 1]|uniref:matrix protein n=1 Tax=Cucurbit cytorhabdovirus 1 TaxID=2730538 RepID=UPI002481FA85|nr:matrix protein [Cucurbit cytorhabdovirus 1]QLT57528.1 matrix protein [Cucurbit cytorhabdovirus 1]